MRSKKKFTLTRQERLAIIAASLTASAGLPLHYRQDLVKQAVQTADEVEQQLRLASK